MKIFSCLALTLLLVSAVSPEESSAQNSDEEAVYAALQKFFEGFATQDSTLMFKYMDREGRLVLTSNDADGQPTMRTFGSEEFVHLLMRPRPQPMKEVIFDPDIRVEDNLAAAWVGYNVWVGDQIDHCGFDHFQLFRSTDGWKIIATADTQQRSGCVPHDQ